MNLCIEIRIGDRKYYCLSLSDSYQWKEKKNMVHIVSAYHVKWYTHEKHKIADWHPIKNHKHICDRFAAACILIQLSCIMLCNLVRHYKFIHIYTVFYLNCNITALENLGGKMPFPHFMLLTQYHVHIYLWYRLSAIQIYLFYRLKSRDCANIMYCNFNGLNKKKTHTHIHKDTVKEEKPEYAPELTIGPHKFQITNSHKLDA